MSIDEKNQVLISQLATMMDKLLVELERLGEDTSNTYPHLKKVKNILKNREPKGLCNIKNYLMMEFRMMTDNQLEGDDLDDAINDIYHFVSSNDIFQKTQ